MNLAALNNRKNYRGVKPLLATTALVGLLMTELMAATGASASPQEPTTVATESNLDSKLEASFWSKSTAPTPEQAQARLKLPTAVKEALLKTTISNTLTATESKLLKDAGLEGFDPPGVKSVTKSSQKPAPVTADALAALDAKMAASGLRTSPAAEAAAQCWINNEEVQAWGITQRWGWKRQVDWCANGSVVTSFHRDIEQPGYISPWWYYRGAEPAISNSTGGPQLKTWRRARFENCPPGLGCGANNYPFIEYTLKGNNTATVNKGIN